MNAREKLNKLVGQGVEVSVRRASGEDLAIHLALPPDVVTADDAYKGGECEGCAWDTKSHPLLKTGENEQLSLCWIWFRRRYCQELRREDVA